MAAPVSGALDIPLGRFVDVASFDAVNKLAWQRLPDRGHHELFAVGLNGLGVRARAADRYALGFDLLFANEPAASPEERFEQDDKLFGFVTNAMAASEAIVFSSFIVARAYDGNPLEEAKLKTPLKGMLDIITSVLQTQALGTFLKGARVERDGESLIELRDVLLHRAPCRRPAGGRDLC